MIYLKVLIILVDVKYESFNQSIFKLKMLSFSNQGFAKPANIRLFVKASDNFTIFKS